MERRRSHSAEKTGFEQINPGTAMHQPFRVNPAQRVPSDIELPGAVTEYDGVAQEPMRLNAAPQSALGCDLNWIWCHPQRVEAEPVEMGPPGRPVIEPCLRHGHQKRDRRRWQIMAPYGVISGIVQHVIGMAGTKQIEKVQPALR